MDLLIIINSNEDFIIIIDVVNQMKNSMKK